MLVNVTTSSVINASVEQVWAKIRDFNGLPDWYPSVIDSQIENGEPSNKIGCIRSFNREDGLNLREQLLGLDDQKYVCTYSLLEPNKPMEDYICTIRLLPITDGDRTYIEWFADFKCLPEEETELRQNLEQVFQVGFDALNKIFSS
ncbi:MAG: SRPBCC family protein [Nostoc sp.]|uniref:SRPBCC family protein n=1 Tax=Nostoc sp. TaxID=1180 RepID=UPI002FF7F9DC